MTDGPMPFRDAAFSVRDARDLLLDDINQLGEPAEDGFDPSLGAPPPATKEDDLEVIAEEVFRTRFEIDDDWGDTGFQLDSLYGGWL